MRTLILVLGLAAAAPAFADCVRPQSAPPVPDGATADQAAMQQAHDAVQGYVNALEAYSACLKQQVTEASAATIDELKATWMAQSDAAIDGAQEAAADFSAQLKKYKARGK